MVEVTGDEYLIQVGGLQCGDYSSESTSHSQIHFYHRGLESLNESQVVLVFIHGYPQSSYMWRHVLKHLPKDQSVFIADIPGYGQSSAIKATPQDKRTVGLAILAALQSKLPQSSTPTKIVIAGHDRGARVAHRLAVDMPPNKPALNLALQGVILMDIVPTVVQWSGFSNPKIAAGYFHWPLLANVEIAIAMITAVGGSNFIAKMFNDTRSMGGTTTGKANLAANNAVEIYSNYFDNPEVVRATCEDYRAGAFEDVDEQKKDQAEGRKIQCDTMLIFSQDALGSRFDIGEVWKEWVAPEVKLSAHGIPDGVGHFLCEEAPDQVSALIEKFLGSLNSK